MVIPAWIAPVLGVGAATISSRARVRSSSPTASCPCGARSMALPLLAPCLLAALVVGQALADGRALELDARVAGVGAAAVALVLRAPLLVVLVSAAGVAAATRALGLMA